MLLLRRTLGASRSRRRTACFSSAELFDETFAVAPMMDYTDRSYRKMFRMLSKKAVLYTEMVAANSLVDAEGNYRHDDPDRWLGHDDAEGVTVLQLGGAVPEQLFHAAKLASTYDYAGINLNCGCPSERVAGAGCFGAAMMRSPSLVAECCAAIAEGAPDMAVSVKCRVGVVPRTRDLRRTPEELEVEYAELEDFVQTVQRESGVKRFIVHARVAVMEGLSPHANRLVPPLRPELVSRLARSNDLSCIFNGEVNSLENARDRLSLPEINGVMVGRDACKRPWHYARTDTMLCGSLTDPALSRRAVLMEYAEYAEAREEKAKLEGRKPRSMLLKPLLGLFHGETGSNAFKRQIDATQRDFSLSFGEVLANAMEKVPDRVLDSPPSADDYDDAPGNQRFTVDAASTAQVQQH